MGVETVQSPTVTLSLGAGDCDDHSGLVAGLAMAVGIPARLRVIGYTDDHLVHIFPELFVNGRWYAADTTEPQRGFGWRPKRLPVERVYTLNGEVSDMAGNGTLNVTKGQLKKAIKSKVTEVLSSNWQAGLINLDDVRGYLRVIREGNFPTKNELAVEPAQQAIEDFESFIVTNRVGSLKPAGSSSGLEGLDGFLSSIWGGVKSVVGRVIGTSKPAPAPAPAPGPAPYTPAPYIRPVIRAPQPVAAAGMFGAMGSTVPLLIAGGLALFLILKK